MKFRRSIVWLKISTFVTNATSRDIFIWLMSLVSMLHILGHYLVIKITPMTFGFTCDMNSGLLGESLEFIWTILLPSHSPYMDFLDPCTKVVASGVTNCRHPGVYHTAMMLPLCVGVLCRDHWQNGGIWWVGSENRLVFIEWYKKAQLFWKFLLA